jgi:hypothetical protein
LLIHNYNKNRLPDRRREAALAEFLKVRESQKKWDEINKSEHEFITAENSPILKK